MSINKQRTELINEILEDVESATEAEETLHILLKEYVSKDAISEHDKNISFGQKAADNLAKFAGSWTFIIAFFLILATWITINAVILSKPYDTRCYHRKSTGHLRKNRYIGKKQ